MLLATVYDEAWIAKNITPAMLEELSQDGADSIVEACILRSDGALRAKVQTSAVYVWDESDPHLAPPPGP
jgi:hypothetical protein